MTDARGRCTFEDVPIGKVAVWFGPSTIEAWVGLDRTTEVDAIVRGPAEVA